MVLRGWRSGQGLTYGRIRTRLQKDFQLQLLFSQSCDVKDSQDLLTPAVAGAAQVSTGTMLLEQSARTVIVLVKVRFFTDTKGEPPTARRTKGWRHAVTHTHTPWTRQSGENTHTCLKL